MKLLSDLKDWWRWRMRRGQVHLYGIAEYRRSGTIVSRDETHWRIEDAEGRVSFAAPEAQPNILDLKVGDRVEIEPMFQSDGGSRLSNRFWTVVRRL
jgi:hypothetical protein